MPFSAPTNIGRWPKLLPITTSSLGNCPEPAFIASSRNLRANASSAISLKAEDSQIAIAPASVSARGQGQRVARISRKAFGFRQPELLAHDIRAKHHSDHLVGRMPPAHAFASHSAIRRDDQPFGRNVFQRLADQGCDLIWTLDLQCVVIDHAMTIFLSLITSPIAGRSPGPDEQVSNVSASASTWLSTSRVG